jgi:histidinol phosphatase-like PHP family hydrolase
MIDFHTHTPNSYCSEPDLTLDFYSKVIKENDDLDAVVITDHGMALYFPGDVAWSWTYISDSTVFDNYNDWGNARVDKYLDQISGFKDQKIYPGIEVEMMNDCLLTLDPIYRDKFETVVGSVHYLPVSRNNGFSKDDVIKFWKKHTLDLLNTGIDILGHPFRWISNQTTVTEDIISEIVNEAFRMGIALELNSHYTIPSDTLMLQKIAELGATITFATDSHRSSEIGDFSYHYNTVDKAGLSLNDFNFMQLKDEIL